MPAPPSITSPPILVFERMPVSRRVQAGSAAPAAPARFGRLGRSRTGTLTTTTAAAFTVAASLLSLMPDPPARYAPAEAKLELRGSLAGPEFGP